jgi:hypothetical protein
MSRWLHLSLPAACSALPGKCVHLMSLSMHAWISSAPTVFSCCPTWAPGRCACLACTGRRGGPTPGRPRQILALAAPPGADVRDFAAYLKGCILPIFARSSSRIEDLQARPGAPAS